MRTLSVLILLCLFSVGIYAQDAKALFIAAPESQLPLLTSVNRADFVDFLDSNMQAKVRNRLGSYSEMTNLTENYARIQMTDNSTWEMKVLHMPDSTTVICVVSTVCAPVCDSSIHFYSTEWQELPTQQFLTMPALNDFIQQPDSMTQEEFYRLMQKLDMRLVTVAVSPEEQTLTFNLRTPEYLHAEETTKFDGLLKSIQIRL